MHDLFLRLDARRYAGLTDRNLIRHRHVEPDNPAFADVVGRIFPLGPFLYASDARLLTSMSWTSDQPGDRHHDVAEPVATVARPLVLCCNAWLSQNCPQTKLHDANDDVRDVAYKRLSRPLKPGAIGLVGELRRPVMEALPLAEQRLRESLSSYYAQTGLSPVTSARTRWCRAWTPPLPRATLVVVPSRPIFSGLSKPR